MDLNEISVFIKVVQSGSFRSAAKQLGMPNSTVSSKISSLEKRLGATLIQRTTRKLNITQVGQAYYLKCLEGIEHIKSAEELVSSSQQEALGALRVTAPVQLGAAFFAHFSPLLLKKNPKLKLDFFLTDDAVDLISENVDVAVRVGNLKDSTLIAKKLGNVHFSLFASQSYLKKFGNPKNPRDLENHQCLHFTSLESEEWQLSSPKGSARVKVAAKLTSNDLYLLKELSIEGGGISLLPSFLCSEEIQKKALVKVLPDWKANIRPVHLVYPPQKYVSPKIRAFIEEAAEPLKKFLMGT